MPHERLEGGLACRRDPEPPSVTHGVSSRCTHTHADLKVDTNAFFRTKHDGRLVGNTMWLRTGQFVAVKPQMRHGSAASHLRWDCTCACEKAYRARGDSFTPIPHGDYFR